MLRSKRMGVVGLACAGALAAGCQVGVGDQVPNWSLADTQGRTHVFSEYAGKVVVLEFWATW